MVESAEREPVQKLTWQARLLHHLARAANITVQNVHVRVEDGSVFGDVPENDGRVLAAGVGLGYCKVWSKATDAATALGPGRAAGSRVALGQVVKVRRVCAIGAESAPHGFIQR